MTRTGFIDHIGIGVPDLALAKRYYDELRARGKTHRQALRQLGNRLVGILHICLERGVIYDELVAWPQESQLAA